MMKQLLRDNSGATIIEFAVALPVLVAMIIGVIQFGLVLNANGVMRNAMGEGLRLAKVNPTATDSAVISRARNAMVGVDRTGIQSLTFSRGTTSSNVDTGTMTMTVQLTPIIPFAPIPPIVLTQTKTVYLPE